MREHFACLVEAGELFNLGAGSAGLLEGGGGADAVVALLGDGGGRSADLQQRQLLLHHLGQRHPAKKNSEHITTE